MIDSGKKARIQIYIALSCLPLFYAKSETMIKHDSMRSTIYSSVPIPLLNSIICIRSTNFILTHHLIQSQMCRPRISFLFSIDRTQKLVSLLKLNSWNIGPVVLHWVKKQIFVWNSMNRLLLQTEQNNHLVRVWIIFWVFWVHKNLKDLKGRTV